MSHNEGGSQTGCAWLKLQSSIYMAEGMNKDGLLHLPSTSNVTVSEEGRAESGGWMHLPRFCMAAPARCVSHSSHNRSDLRFLLLFLVPPPWNGDVRLHNTCSARIFLKDRLKSLPRERM